MNMSNDSLNDIVEMHAIVSGDVQGVGFRATTRFHASQLNLKGTVRNLPDGNVEIYAQGTRKQLDNLIELLKKEASPGHISQVDIKYTKLSHSFQGFIIAR